MKKILARIVRKTPILHMLYRLIVALSYLLKPIKNAFVWMFTSREDTNFTYHLERINQLYLASFVSQVTDVNVDTILTYQKELEDDDALLAHIKNFTLSSTFCKQADTNAKYGRRLGWYAFVRALKPKVIVETGTDKGLGSCVLTAALKKNAAEGFNGFLFTIDKNAEAGYLFNAPYNQYGKILVGDSLALLKNLKENIDIFIHDSNHAPEFEMSEFKAIDNRVTKTGLIISDNAHVSHELWKFAKHTSRDFLYFQEKPKDHWYPGAGIGVAFRKNRNV